MVLAASVQLFMLVTDATEWHSQAWSGFLAYGHLLESFAQHIRLSRCCVDSACVEAASGYCSCVGCRGTAV
jgi:hypothetical protein